MHGQRQNQTGIQDAVDAETHANLVAHRFDMHVRGLAFHGVTHDGGHDLHDWRVFNDESLFLPFLSLLSFLDLLHFSIGFGRLRFDRFSFSGKFGFQLRQSLSHFPGQASVHIDDFVEVIESDQKDLIRDVLLAGQEIQGVARFHVIRIDNANLQRAFLETDRHKTVMQSRILRNIIQHFEWHARFIERAHRNIEEFTTSSDDIFGFKAAREQCLIDRHASRRLFSDVADIITAYLIFL